MPSSLTIEANWESLDRGSAEERACFAAVGITAHNIWLTEGRDAIANRLRHAPLLSAYHLAEWIGWNWWRLRWEPRSRTEDWAFAHRLSAIGGGYVWPNITIFSDGERIALIAKPTGDRPQTPFRYICDAAAIIPAVEFESEIDRFIDQVLQRLQSEQLSNTNLESVWSDVRDERSNPELARKRKLEALLGRDPDEADPRTVDKLIADAAHLSFPAIEELAADPDGQSASGRLGNAAGAAQPVTKHTCSRPQNRRMHIAYLALVETTSAVCSIYDIGRRAGVASAGALRSRPITLEKYSPGGGRRPANRRDGD